MNWRLLTTINAIIALVTVGAVLFDLTRPRIKQSSSKRQETFQSNAANNQLEKPDDTNSIENVDVLENVLYDDLGVVPAVELTDLLRGANPEMFATLALKFNLA